MAGAVPNSEYQFRRILRVILLLSLCTYIAGIFSFFLIPRFPEQTLRNTYISENALLPVAAYPANEWTEELTLWTKRLRPSDSEIEALIRSWGGEFHSVPFHCNSRSTFDPLSSGTLLDPFVTAATSNHSGRVLYAIVRAAKTHGGEGIAIATKRSGPGLALALQLFRVMSKARWLSKDLVLILADASYTRESLSQLLSSYNSRTRMARAGQLQAALVLDVNEPLDGVSNADVGVVHVLPEGANGQLTNLDLLNTLALGFEHERVRQQSLVLPAVAALKLPNPLPGLASFVVTLASGVPTGSHYLLQRHHIDAVTVRAAVRVTDAQLMQRIGRVLEMTCRSLNNLVEVLHQSFYFYLLADHKRFISIGTYMIPFGLIAVPLPLTMLALFYSSSGSEGSAVRTAAQLVAAQLVGVLAFVAAPLTGFDWRLVTAGAVIVGALLLAVWRRAQPEGREWTGARALAALPLSALLSCASLLNFSFALVAAVFLVPVYSLALALAPRRLLPIVAVLLSALVAAALTRPELHADVWPQLLQEFGSLWMPLVVLVLVPLHLSLFLLGI